MRENLVKIIGIICITILTLGTILIISNIGNQEEKVKLLEKSLNEQIQEKQVYINILEKSNLAH